MGGEKKGMSEPLVFLESKTKTLGMLSRIF